MVKIYFEKSMAMFALQIAKTIQKAMVNIIDHYARRGSQLNDEQLHILTDLQVILSETVVMNCIGNDKLAV